MSDYIELHVCEQPQIELEVKEQIVIGGGGITPTGTKTINVNSNGTTTEDVTTYASAQIVANVPNSYSAGDEGKVVDDGALVSQTTRNVTANGTYDTTTNNSTVVNVPASAVDTGTKNITSNGTHDVVGYANASVAVHNSYTASDEGKVVSNGALVAQTSDTVTQNGTVNTTLINSLTVNVSAGGTDYLAQRCNGTLTEYRSDAVVEIADNTFRDDTALQTLTVPNCKRMGAYAIANTGISTLSLPAAEYMGLWQFGVNKYGVAQGCANLETADFGVNLIMITQAFFINCSKLSVVVIRKSDSVTNLGQMNVFNGTCFASDGTGGTLYVPSSLVSSYQQATNWSTILGYANNQIKSIESTHTDPTAPIDLTLYYADGTPIT